MLKYMATVAGCESRLYILRKEGVYDCTGYAFHNLELLIYCIAEYKGAESTNDHTCICVYALRSWSGERTRPR